VDYWNCVPDVIIAAEENQHPQGEWSGVLNVCHVSWKFAGETGSSLVS
jgi:hypothetical protein